MTELQIVVLNMCLYIVLLLVLCIKYKLDNLSVFLSFIYCVSSIFSFLLFTFPLYKIAVSYEGSVSLEGILFLFIANALVITTFRNFTITRLVKVTSCNITFTNRIQFVLNAIFFIYVLFTLPLSISYFLSGNLGALRDGLYETNAVRGPFVIGLIGRFLGGCSIFLLLFPVLNYLIKRSFDRKDFLSLCLYASLKVSTILGVVSRATIIFSFFDLFVVLLVFHSLFNLKEIRRIKMLFVLILSSAGFIFILISESRFSDEKIGYFDLATLRYAGEAQLNFSALMYPDLNNPFHGYTQFSLFRRFLGMDYDDGLKRNLVWNTYIMKNYQYYHPTYVFYSLIGTWYANWGGIITMTLALLFNLFFSSSKKNITRMSYFRILCFLVLACYVAKGVFFADYQNESGNMLIIYLCLIYYYLKKYGRTYILENN